MQRPSHIPGLLLGHWEKEREEREREEEEEEGLREEERKRGGGRERKYMYLLRKALGDIHTKIANQPSLSKQTTISVYMYMCMLSTQI